VSPAEPKEIKQKLAMVVPREVTVSPYPEKLGLDFCWFEHDSWWGVQRKELKDFVASVNDGRLAKEIGQMQQVSMPIIIIEGKIRYTTENVLIWNSWGQEITKPAFRGMIWSIMNKGVNIQYTVDADDTVVFIAQYAAWTRKDKHESMVKRTGPVNAWGKPDNKDYQIHLLQGLPGVGVGLATKIVEKFGGIPWQWTCTIEQLMEVDGVGKKKASMIWNALQMKGMVDDTIES
jgi:ERCC4-type nuclease